MDELTVDMLVHSAVDMMAKKMAGATVGKRDVMMVTLLVGQWAEKKVGSLAVTLVQWTAVQ